MNVEPRVDLGALLANMRRVNDKAERVIAQLRADRLEREAVPSEGPMESTDDILADIDLLMGQYRFRQAGARRFASKSTQPGHSCSTRHRAGRRDCHAAPRSPEDSRRHL